MDNTVHTTTLDNGLKICLKEIHSAPIVSHWLWYRVGSRNEVDGLTGLSHWVEHMQFKGTATQPGAVMERTIARVGGIWNAFTHLDWTTYYETLPSNQLELAIQIEVDRMQNTTFTAEEVDFERSVIMAEKDGKDNDPLSRLNSAVIKAAFTHHPYQNEIIGSHEDLTRIQAKDLQDHYRCYYQPANALLSLSGDFDSKEMMQRLNQAYSVVDGKDVVHTRIQAEPLLDHSQEITMHGPGENSFLQIAYRAPAAADPDFFAYTILDSLLTGPASLNMFGGGGISNRTSRLYQRLVEKEFALGVAGGLQATIDPFIYDLMITIHPEHSPDEVIGRFDQEINKLLNQKVSGKEIERAKKQAAALFAYGLENITNQAFWMGYSEMFATYDWFSHYLDHLNAVQPRHVLNVAQKYLNPGRRIVGLFLPNSIEVAD